MDDLPRLDSLVVVRHVGHRAAGGHVGEDDLDGVGREHVRGFRHEVHAAEDNVLHPDALSRAILDDGGRELGELERVAEEIRMADNLVHLVMVPENDEFFAELGAPRFDLLVQLIVVQTQVMIGERGLPEHVASCRKKGQIFYDPADRKVMVLLKLMRTDPE